MVRASSSALPISWASCFTFRRRELGSWDAAHLNTAITLPIGVEAYGAYALGAWLTPGASERARKFAKWSAVGALLLGMLGQRNLT